MIKYNMCMAIIGVIDSGIGGLSILKAISSKAPLNRFVYLADTFNAPYGKKSKLDIIDYTKMCCDKVLSKGADIIVLACNTATAAAVDEMRKIYDIPIIGTEPAIAPALRDNCKRVLVMATPFTLESDRYHNLIKENKDKLVKLSLGDLAERIEQISPNYNKLIGDLESLLAPYKDCDGIVLGCTHYALIKNTISLAMPYAKIYTSARGIAKRIVDVIEESSLEEEENCLHMLSTSKTDMTRYIDLYNKITDY